MSGGWVEQKVDVFLCHAGEQKLGIVSHLDSALRRAGFTVFLDINNMVIGQYSEETIYPALTNACVVVIVLSLDFIRKEYPLKELFWALQHRKYVVPVFFGITRTACSKLLDADFEETARSRQSALDQLQALGLSDADSFRNVAREFSDSLNIVDKLKLASGGDPGKLQGWKQALAEFAKVGNIDPHDPNKPLTSEAQLVDKVVHEVMRITGHPLLSLPKYRVELDKDRGRMRALLQLVARGYKLGLFGVGGIGKTTLSRAIFNHLAAQFSPGDCASCEVGQRNEPNDLLECANKVLKQLGRPEVSDLGQVKPGLLDGRKILLLLDDLWHTDQVKKVVEPLLRGLADSSVVLCTSRSKELLLRIHDETPRGLEPVLDCQEVHGLEDQAARRLFRWHAFGSDPNKELQLPPAVQKGEVKILQSCAGVPLALELMGGLICTAEDKFHEDTWQGACACLGVSKDGVMDRILEQSLNKLGSAAMDMFLDVACFFRGELKAEALWAWSGTWHQGYESCAQAQLRDLLSSNLCSVDSEGRLTMHDLVCDLGRTKTWERAELTREKQQWLWDSDETFEALTNAKVSPQVRTLQLTKRSLQDMDFPPITQLLFMSINRCSSCWSMDTFPSELLLLRCTSADWDHLPGHLPFTKLKVLRLLDCVRLTSLSEGISALTALRMLDLNGCSHLNSLPGGISCLTALRMLDLSLCIKLQNLPEGISTLTDLRMLCLKSCWDLRNLPDSISALRALETLYLSGCDKLKSLPEGIRALRALQTLHLAACKNLQGLPAAITVLSGLQRLCLSWVRDLQSLPDGMMALTGMQQLDLSGCCNLQSLPVGIGALTKLQKLFLQYCDLHSLPEGISALVGLKELDMRNCSNLQSLPEGISTLTGLQELDLRGCNTLQSLPKGISALTGLKTLAFSLDGDLQSLLEGISALTDLEHLALNGCHNLPESISTLSGLKTLDFSHCSLQGLPEGISALTGLTKLDLCHCSSLQSLPGGIRTLTALQQLHLGWCNNLQSLPEGISALSGLEQLDLSRCSNLLSLPKGISALTGLKTWDLYQCSNLQSLPESISALTTLQELKLMSCERLQSLPEGISALTGLTALGLEHCSTLQNLPESVSALSGLRSLGLQECSNLQSLPEGISALTGLDKLDLSGCSILKSLPEGISALRGLRILWMSGCKNLQHLPEGISTVTGLNTLVLYSGIDLQGLPEGISALSSLQRLALTECGNLQSLPEGISTLSCLKELDLSHCSNLQSLPEGISALSCLKELDLNYCSNLQSLPEGISALTALQSLALYMCKSLQRLPEGISVLTALKTLDLRRCSKLQSLPAGICALSGLQLK